MAALTPCAAPDRKSPDATRQSALKGCCGILKAFETAGALRPPRRPAPTTPRGDQVRRRDDFACVADFARRRGKVRRPAPALFPAGPKSRRKSLPNEGPFSECPALSGTAALGSGLFGAQSGPVLETTRLPVPFSKLARVLHKRRSQSLFQEITCARFRSSAARSSLRQ